MNHVAALGLTMALAFGLASCSSVRRISDNASEIRTEAKAIERRSNDVEIRVRAARIESLASGIHRELTQVEDKEPMWLSTLWTWGIVLGLVAVALILWQSGIGAALRVAVGWIPRKKQSEAAFIEAVLDPNRPESAREYVAARRAADPELNAAMSAKEHRK